MCAVQLVAELAAVTLLLRACCDPVTVVGYDEAKHEIVVHQGRTRERTTTMNAHHLWHYVRYALSVLACVGFGRMIN